MTCTDTRRGEPTTIQVPGGGWLKQGWTDLSAAATAAPGSRTSRTPGDQANFGAINHRATLWVDGKVGTQVTSYTHSVFDISDYVRPGKPAEIELLVKGARRWSVPTAATPCPKEPPGPTTWPRASSGRPTSRSSPPSTSPTPSSGPRSRTGTDLRRLGHQRDRPRRRLPRGPSAPRTAPAGATPIARTAVSSRPARPPGDRRRWRGGHRRRTGGRTFPTAPATALSCTSSTSALDPRSRPCRHPAPTCASASVRSSRSVTTSS